MSGLCNRSFFYVKCIFIAVFFLFSREYTHASDNISMNSTIILTDHDGNSIALWVNSNSNGMNVQSAVLPFGTTSWGDPVVLSETRSSLYGLKASIDSLDNILVAWVNLDPDSPILCVNANSFSKNSLSWNDPTNVSGSSQNTNDDISISIVGGNMNVIWSAYDETGNKLLYSVTSSVIEGTWSSPMEISTPPAQAKSSKINKT